MKNFSQDLNTDSVLNTPSISKCVAQVKAFLAVCLTPQDADHTNGGLERRIRRNSLEVSLRGKNKEVPDSSQQEGKG